MSGQPFSRYTEAPAYAATLAITPNAGFSYILPGQLTGAMTVNATETNCAAGDQLVMEFNTDGTQRIVTFGTNFIPNGTLTIPASKRATAFFIYNGANFMEIARTIEP